MEICSFACQVTPKLKVSHEFQVPRCAVTLKQYLARIGGELSHFVALLAVGFKTRYDMKGISNRGLETEREYLLMSQPGSYP